MVNPVYIIIISLIAGFSLPLFDRLSRKVAYPVFLGVLAANLLISVNWIHNFLYNEIEQISFETAGFLAPLSINFRVSVLESIILIFVNFIGFMTAIYLGKRFEDESISSMILYIIMLMGVNGIVLTQDLFNSFVFLEIISISTIALVTLGRRENSISSGFKYMLASGIASIFYLLGVVLIYFFTGNLNLAYISNSFTGYSVIAVYLLAIGLMIELKSFPINGWALDVYESTNPGIATLISVVSSTGIVFTFYKIMPIIPTNFLMIFGIIAGLTFLVSNLMALKQDNSQRLLGYSSIGQIGLLLASIIFTQGLNDYPRLIIVGGFFLNHLLAKTGLFWLSGIVNKTDIKDWAVLRNHKSLLVVFGLLIFALAGLPPFAGFWAKWTFIKALVNQENYAVMVLILLGSLMEIVYLLRWFISVAKSKTESKITFGRMFTRNQLYVLYLLTSIIVATGLIFVRNYFPNQVIMLLPIIGLISMLILDFLPSKFKGILSLIAVVGFGYYLYNNVGLENPIQILFGVIFIIGSAINIISTLNRKGNSLGFYGLLLMMIFSFGNLLIATSYLEFFFSWELMTISSFLLILRGKSADKAALMYMIFSMAGAYLMISGFAFAPNLLTGTSLIDSFSYIELPLISIILLSIGFMIKSGVLGLHVWLPEAHAEAEADVSSFISAILLKAGIWGFLLVAVSAIAYGPQIDIYFWIGWIGVFTALVGAFLAAFQEDMKRLLAYSSMSQVGYIIAAASMLSHLGWVSAFYLSLNHMMFKSALFIAIAGIYFRTKTRNMYEMGGLIKKMPLSFISVLISIIAVSGVPPLSGFGSKWLMYSSFIERGWYLQAGVLFFASAVSFLYLYRLIHTVFLGQAKHEHKDVKEAPVWFILPQYIYIGAIMVLSTFPNLLIRPLSNIAKQYFSSNIIVDGYNVYSSYGHWNGNLIMLVTMGVFIVPLFFLILYIGKITKVKQFNIVFAAERPESPQTTHVAHNMFAHYRKALGGWGKPRISNFWQASAEWTHSLADVTRRIYSGNGQTYLLHIILFFVLVFFLGV